MKSAKSDKLSKIEMIGRFLTKEIDAKNVVILSEEASICVLNLSDEKHLKYSFLLTNNDIKENSKWDKLSFEIKMSMNLSTFINQNVECFQWNTEKNIYFFEILCDELNDRNKKNFIKVLEQCLYSLNKNIPANKAALQIKQTSKKYVKNFGIIENLEEHVDNELKKLKELNEKKNTDEKLSKEMNNLELSKKKFNSVINVQISKKIFSIEGNLFNYNTEKEQMINLYKDKKIILNIYQIDIKKFDYTLCTETKDGFLISIDKISDTINAQVFDINNKNTFVWITNKCYIKIDTNCLGFQIEKEENLKNLQNLINKCNYESKNGQSFDKVDEKNKILLEKAIDYNNINCFSSDEEEKEEKKEKKNRKIIMDYDNEKYKEIESEKEKLNKFCIDSLSNDRTFCITDDNQIVVYKANQEENTIEKISCLPVVKEYEKNNINFSHGVLYKSENNILLLDENNPYIIYQYDFPKQKIISEWKTEHTPIEDICNIFKNGQTTDESLIYGVNYKAVFTMDDRINNKNSISDIKTYTNKNYTNKILSNNEGKFITGSTKGDLRFYDKIGIKAKNLYSFYGDPIRFMDISADDKYILLTCDKYLLLINTEKEGDKNAFIKTIVTEQRKTPLRLQIKTTDIMKYGLEEANYTGAKFNNNKNGENNIITSLGEYIIIWNYNDIRKGKISNYKIKKVSDLIIDNYFKVGDGNKIIVAMPTKVRMQSQKTILEEKKNN